MGPDQGKGAGTPCLLVIQEIKKPRSLALERLRDLVHQISRKIMHHSINHVKFAGGCP